MDDELEVWKVHKKERILGIWHLGKRKKQKRGFLSILGSLDKPLLVSAAGAVSGEILKGIEKTLDGEKEDQNEEKEKWEDLAMPRNNILLQMLPAPKRVQLPNGRFYFIIIIIIIIIFFFLQDIEKLVSMC